MFSFVRNRQTVFQSGPFFFFFLNPEEIVLGLQISHVHGTIIFVRCLWIEAALGLRKLGLLSYFSDLWAGLLDSLWGHRKHKLCRPRVGHIYKSSGSIMFLMCMKLSLVFRDLESDEELLAKLQFKK